MSTQATTSGPANSNPNEPKWTTGQGIGFLVSLCGWLIAAAGLIGLMITAPAGAGDDELVSNIRSLGWLRRHFCHSGDRRLP